MFKKFFLTAAVALTALTASAALPSVNLTDIHGNTIDTATLSNDGKPMIISFFATWCKPCMRELKAIHEVYPDWQDETGVRLIAVSIDEGQNALKVKPLAKVKDGATIRCSSTPPMSSSASSASTTFLMYLSLTAAAISSGIIRDMSTVAKRISSKLCRMQPNNSNLPHVSNVWPTPNGVSHTYVVINIT